MAVEVLATPIPSNGNRMKKEKILVVDDEEDILELVRYNLAREGYTVVCAASGEEALQAAEAEPLDLIILDLMLPGIDGLEVARRFRQNSRTKETPIVMLTAKGEEADVVAGLELGADDYVTKPFSPRILIARMRAVIRRRSGLSEMNGDVLKVRELAIHPGRRHVTANGQSLDLTYTEFQVLFFLAKRPGWVFTRTQIVDAVRGDDYPVTDRSVDVQIVGLRKKLGRFGHYIETVRGVGYRFIES
ncbi:DNA-binding response regulator [Desulfosarcina ovata subsp. ovata]|uniref:DNA-binding response regulator n=2 Tax=Desulfosarcina ovata TaxID=83564 RepID=A0A5K8A5Q7_9BACT|nr:DNA-binding response regulator [Desulfosarcina ovata subsp. ovata]